MNQNTAEAVIMFRARDEASEEIEHLREELNKTDRSFGFLTKGAARLGFGIFSLGKTLKEFADTSRMLSDVQRGLDATFKILAPRMQEAFAGLDKFDLGRTFGVSISQINEIATMFARNAGDMEMTTEELALAIKRTFGLMALSGADAAATAAAVLGQHYQGNAEDLQKLADRSGRMLISMEDLDEASQIWIDNLNPFTEIMSGIQRQWENFTQTVMRFGEGDNPFEIIRDWWNEFWPDFSTTLPNFLDFWTNIPLSGMSFQKFASQMASELAVEFARAVKNWASDDLPGAIGEAILSAFNAAKGIGHAISAGIFEPLGKFFSGMLPEFFKTAFGGIDLSVIGDIGKAIGEWFVDSIFDPIKQFFSQTLPDFFNGLGDWFKDFFINGPGGDGGSGQTVALPSAGYGGGGGTVIQVIFNNPVIDSAARQAEVTREVRRALSEEVRRGVGI